MDVFVKEMYKRIGRVDALYHCTNYRGLSLLSVVGKVYGRILIERIRNSSDMAIGEEEWGFREGRGCTDQIFAVREMSEKRGYIIRAKIIHANVHSCEFARMNFCSNELSLL